MASFSKRLTVHEVTELLEQGDIDDIFDDVTDIFMEPPVNANNDITDEDSDDGGPIGDINRMPASLLNAHIVIHDSDTENTEVANKHKVSGNTVQKKIKQKIAHRPRNKIKKTNQDAQQTVLWREGDLETPNIFVDDQKTNLFYSPLQPYELFELFFDQQVLEMIVDYSNSYTSNKNQTLQIDVNELKCFLGILLLSGYNEVSRRRMYWEKSPDTYNNLVSIRGKKWYSCIVLYSIDVAVQNAWQLHKLHTEKPMDLLAFRRHIATYYLQKFNKVPNPGRKGGKPSSYIPRYDGVMHYLVPQEKQTRCAECHQKTTSRCNKCDVGLHLKCNIQFHTLK
ncbi:piggyBac transposable element-derived protein 3-like [Daktulosphaira vitifoliae]|uniref:piggyBac transposable element-derived protein 3-like n=1 Tax=Daktulosphaira vitifoliae TaxID=58002 RepID=UPI0021AAF069|nr:piggyBac transposable element-derived protein 3-like [Daktulosphaira vitifoliae]